MNADVPRTMDAMNAKLLAIAAAKGEEAGRKFVKDYGIGRNRNVDRLILEGIETQNPMLIQRLPWADFGKNIPTARTIIVSIGVDHDALDVEVVDDLIWVFIQAFDTASRGVITKACGKEDLTNGS